MPARLRYAIQSFGRIWVYQIIQRVFELEASDWGSRFAVSDELLEEVVGKR